MTDSRLKELQNELIRRQTLQTQARAMADKAINDIQQTINELVKIADEQPDFYSEYPELHKLTAVDINELINNPDNIAEYEKILTELSAKIENYLEMALNV